MALDEYCKEQIISVIQSKLNSIPSFLQGPAKIAAEQEINGFISSISRAELNSNLREYLDRHPEVQSQYPQAVQLLPICTYKYTMQELIDCLNEIRRNF